MRRFWCFLGLIIMAFNQPQGLDRRVTGTVFSWDNGAPLTGAAIREEGGGSAVFTDPEGKFSLNVSGQQPVLVVSFRGFETRRIEVGSRVHLNIGLKPEPEVEEEIAMEADLLMPSRASKMAQGQVSHYAAAPYEPDFSYHNTEEYDRIRENVFHSPRVEPLSTFSIDVDGASYSNARRFLNGGQLPPVDAVRIEEFVNYFTYDYQTPQGEEPFSITSELSMAPWNEDHKLLHVGIQGRQLDYQNLKPSNLVFLIDVSGSMSSPNKLPLLKSSLKMLLGELGREDRVAIVAYAGAAGLVLPSCPATDSEAILNALDNLKAGGSTAGGAGIQLAYKVALRNLIKGGNNRVILATDGDFNVGVSSTSEMVRLIEEKRNQGVYLTITGFGMGNYKDGRMEQISNAGNGNYFYIDNIREARKVFVTEMRANLFTIAKDVKIQVEFNPEVVQGYRLIGYENRVLNSEDFNDDQRDAGELGAGHSVTALYEIIPVGVKTDLLGSVDPLKYQSSYQSQKRDRRDLLTMKIRYKEPSETESRLIEETVSDSLIPWDDTSNDFRFSAAAASFAMLLRNSDHKGESNYQDVITWAWDARGDDTESYRLEFVILVRSAEMLAKR